MKYRGVDYDIDIPYAGNGYRGIVITIGSRYADNSEAHKSAAKQAAKLAIDALLDVGESDTQ